jgi:hypothetical protein
MSAWSIVTLLIDSDESVYDEELLRPTCFVLDSGVDEQGWIETESDNKVYYALSFGRYQGFTFQKHMSDMHCPKYSGVTLAHIIEANDTGDNVKVRTYLPRQLKHDSRVDGYTCVESFEGNVGLKMNVVN